MTNRTLMMEAVIAVARAHLPPFALGEHAVNCHHNYVEKEHHFGEEVYVTRKGAVRISKTKRLFGEAAFERAGWESGGLGGL